MKQMKPEDFGLSMMDQAQRLRRHALQHSRTTQLDPKTSMWLIREDHRRRLIMELDVSMMLSSIKNGGNVELLGIPVRFTIGDAPETPELQLVMEPMLKA